WIIIGTWLATSLDAANLVAALPVAAGFGLFSIGGAVWARDEAGRSIFLVLFAYVFLIFIAAQPALAIPPWPIFVVLLVGILAITPWPEFAIFAVAITAIATAAAPTHTPAEKFFFALPFYLLFVVWPFLGGSEIAAVLGSGAFFFFARQAMMAAGLGYMIGVLPVAEAAVLLLLVWRSRGTKDLTNLAIVAGAALAFITVAIPLQ